jgi:predicted ribosome-associated RNA-binding protein Tma20
VEQEEGEEEKEEKTVADLIYLDGEVLFVSASKYFPFLCKIHCYDYS